MSVPAIDTSLVMLALGGLFVLLGAGRYVQRPAARIQSLIWLAVGIIFLIVAQAIRA